MLSHNVFPVCQVIPEVDNSNVTTLTDEKLANGAVVFTKIKYFCNDGYHLDDESNAESECKLGAFWSPKILASCLKGIF